MAIIISSLILIQPSKTLSQNYNRQNITQICNSQYTIRMNIDGKWFLVTYNSDGYIINVVEDDE